MSDQELIDRLHRKAFGLFRTAEAQELWKRGYRLIVSTEDKDILENKVKEMLESRASRAS